MTDPEKIVPEAVKSGPCEGCAGEVPAAVAATITELIAADAYRGVAKLVGG